MAKKQRLVGRHTESERLWRLSLQNGEGREGFIKSLPSGLRNPVEEEAERVRARGMQGTEKAKPSDQHEQRS